MHLPPKIHEWDERIYRALSRRTGPAEDTFFSGLSALGDASRVWWFASGLAAAAGGSKGRRTAGEVMAAVGLASLVSNIVVKWAVRRKRPVWTLPLLVRAPRSRSFPSGHSATSFAAATVLARRYPAAAVPAFALAAGIATSRIYVGVHYPLDVVAGASIGAALGGAVLAAQRLALEAPTKVEATPGAFDPDTVRVALVVNASSGGSLGSRVPEDVSTHELAEGSDVAAVFGDLAEQADVLGVAGGDGTVGSAAKVAAEHDRVLWVIPAGTLNHFACALGFTDVDHALASLDDATVAEVDLAAVEDVVFVNNASLGIYGEWVQRREDLEHRFKLGTWPAMVIGLATVLRRHRPMELIIDGKPERAYLVFVGNNRYRGKRGLRGRSALQEGLLDIRVLRARGRWPRTAAVLGILTGSLRSSGIMRGITAARLEVRLPEPVLLAHDGEIREVSGTIEFRSLPRALRVVVPQEKAASGQ